MQREYVIVKDQGNSLILKQHGPKFSLDWQRLGRVVGNISNLDIGTILVLKSVFEGFVLTGSIPYHVVPKRFPLGFYVDGNTLVIKYSRYKMYSLTDSLLKGILILDELARKAIRSEVH